MTYDASGMRTSRVGEGKFYRYVYRGGLLRQMTVGDEELRFTFDVNGIPLSVTYDNDEYYYVTSLQGDVIAIVNNQGQKEVEYTYDAWGNILSTTGSMANTLGELNPLRYRGYVYDTETGFYYLQSRYYDPNIGRFINADGQISGVGGEILGYNMFTYCMNNPVNMSDPSGNWPSWSNLLKGSAWLAVGITAVCVGVSVLTCGVATPVMTAVALTTIGAGSLTAINGTAEIGEAFTGCNFVRDTVFSGNQKAYDAYANTIAAVAEVGTAVCGGWIVRNSPRINAYKSMEFYNVKSKHLSSGGGGWSKFNTASQAELRALGREALKKTPMRSLILNSADSYAAIYNFGRVIGTSGETSARLVFSTAGKIITFFPQ